MANPDQLKEARQLEQHELDLIMAYREFEGSYVYRDLMEHLEAAYNSSQAIAGSEMENMDKKALYLQDAHAYGKVIAYIKDKLLV